MKGKREREKKKGTGALRIRMGLFPLAAFLSLSFTLFD